MARRAASLAITDRYRDALVGLRARVLGAVTASWRQTVSLDDLDGTVAAWARGAGAVIEAGKAQAAAHSDVYLAAFVASELGKPQAPRGAALPAVTRDPAGRTLEEAAASSAIAVKVALAYRRPGPEALAAGLLRGQRLAAGEVARAGRDSLAGLMAADENVEGWLRVTGPAPCGACIAAATGAIRSTDEVPEAHTYCQCVAEPVVRGVRDAHPRPTGQELFDALTPAEQDALFAGRGGAAKADLIRSGRAPLSSLIERTPMAAGPAQITEAPLSALTT